MAESAARRTATSEEEEQVDKAKVCIIS